MALSHINQISGLSYLATLAWKVVRMKEKANLLSLPVSQSDCSKPLMNIILIGSISSYLL